MPKAAPIFPTFSSGEVTPLLYGRVDMQQYYNGLETAENCLVRPYGLIMNRPGLEFIAPVKFPLKITRLLEFIFSESDAFIIEFGEFYFRFFTLGGAVTETPQAITSASNTNPVNLGITAHGYVIDDELIINDMNGMTELNGKRFRVNSVPGVNNITIKDLDGNTVDGTSFGVYTSGGTAELVYEVVHTYTEDELRDVHIAQINDVLDLAHGDHMPASLTRMALTNWVLADINFIGGPVQATNLTATTITPSSDTGATTLTASAPIFLAGHVGSIWRVKDGFVKITVFTSTTVVSGTVQTTSLNTGPAATTDWAEGSWSNVAGFPATVTYHERRRWYARTDTQPQTQWASKPFIYDDYTAGANDDDALDLTLNTELANDIKWLSSGTSLATGTFGGEFITSSGTTQISLTPDNANAVRQTGWGSVGIQPKKISNFIYYVQRAARKIREFFYFWDLDTYKSIDMTILSEHITESGIIGLAYQQNPDSTLWCLRNDGQIATLTREDEQQVRAWTRQVTDGQFSSVAAIPSNLGPYDEAWVAVEREIDSVQRQYIERFANPIVPDRQDDCFYVDSGLKFNSYDQTTGISLALSSTSGTITATASAPIFSANDVGQRIRAIDEDGGMLGEMEVDTFTSTTIVVGTSTATFSTNSYAANFWGISVIEVSGLDHLEAKDVSILGDGAVQTQQTVVSGMITLERDAFKLSIGLPYRSIVKTLSLEAGASKGTAQGQIKRIYQIGLKVFKTLGIKVGGSLDKLFNVTLRTPQDPMGEAIDLVSGTISNIRFTGGWVIEGVIVIVQDNPLPMHILAIMPLEETNEK